MQRCDRGVTLVFDNQRMQQACQLPVGHVGPHPVYFAVHDGAHESPAGGSFVEWEQVNVEMPGWLQYAAGSP